LEISPANKRGVAEVMQRKWLPDNQLGKDILNATCVYFHDEPGSNYKLVIYIFDEI
jgi:hypothetical protein